MLRSDAATMMALTMALFSVDGFSRVRALERAPAAHGDAAEPQEDPGREARIQRVLADAQARRDRKNARRAARLRPRASAG